MFDSLKKKFSGWFKKEEEPKAVETEKKSKKEKSKKKVKGAKKEKAEKKKVESVEELKEEIREEVKEVQAEEAKEEEPKAEEGEKKGFFKRLFGGEEKEEAKERNLGGLKEKELTDLIRRIQSLSKKDIDKLFADCGWNDTGGEGNLSLPDWRLEKIKEDESFARNILESFVQECSVDEIFSSLDKLEKLNEEEEAEKEVEELAEKEESGGFFSKIAKKMGNSVLKEEEFDSDFDEFEMELVENNVALEVVDEIRKGLKNSLVGKEFAKGEVESGILSALRKSIELVLVESEDLVKRIKNFDEDKPFVILFFGINGSGKTTSVAKMAWKLKEEGIDCVMAAADTFRAASIEQLEKHGKKIGVEVVKQAYGSDPAAVAFDAISFAKAHKKKVVLIDTAGRMYTKANLMKEMAKIVRVSQPDLKIFVGESITGNDATSQARMFAESAGIDGSILTKADVDDKAGAILSVGFVTSKPIFYLGVGQEYKDLERFDKGRVMTGLGLAG